jgi:hypothetical protein
MINIVGAQSCPKHFLKKIIFFVGAPGRTKPGQSVRTIFFLDIRQFFSDVIQSFVPTGFLELASFLPSDEGMGQPVLAVDKLKAKSSFNTEPATVMVFGIRINPNDLIAMGAQGNITTASTVGTGGVGEFNTFHTGLA